MDSIHAVISNYIMLLKVTVLTNQKIGTLSKKKKPFKINCERNVRS